MKYKKQISVLMLAVVMIFLIGTVPVRAAEAVTEDSGGVYDVVITDTHRYADSDRVDITEKNCTFITYKVVMILYF